MMCGRFALTLPVDAMAQLFSAVPANNLPPLPSYNICPTNDICTVIHTDQRRLIAMRWGFMPHWYKSPDDRPLLINARAETLAEKPAFRSAARERRCLIPASGFYEWTVGEDGKRLPWYICRPDGEPLVFAGIWQKWEGDGKVLTTCAIVTTNANKSLSKIHDRIPVVLDSEDWGLWLGEKGKGAALLMHAPPEDMLCAYRVSTDINSNRAQGPQLIEPIER